MRMRIAFELAVIGAGRMGYAIASSLVSRGVVPARKIILADPQKNLRRRAALLGCRAVDNAAEASASARTILLAVKPQRIADVAPSLRACVRGKLVISILAGTTRRRLSALLPGSRIVRVMPNTPLMSGKGATAIAKDRVSRADLRRVIRIFASVGRVWTVPEEWMNAVTAVSGSGPALVCAFLEALAEGGRGEGLPAALAFDLARQTLIGTAALLDSDRNLSPESLRINVTSPGGTTEAALNEFRRRNLARTVAAGVRSAVRRGRLLAR